MKPYQLFASLTVVVTTAQASFAFYSGKSTESPSSLTAGELGALGKEIRIKGLTNGTGEVESNICVSTDTILSVWGEFTQHGLPFCIQGFGERGCREEDLTISKDWVHDTGTLLHQYYISYLLVLKYFQATIGGNRTCMSRSNPPNWCP